MTSQDHAMPLQQGEHALYLLRIWYEYEGHCLVWRASVKPPYENRRRFFTSPDALLSYLSHCLSPGTTAT
jgi:hypothetical protein